MTIPEVSAAQAHHKYETQTPTEAPRTALLAAELTAATVATVATLSSTTATADITTEAEAHVELRVAGAGEGAGAGAEAATPAGETEWAEMTQQRKRIEARYMQFYYRVRSVPRD